MMAVFLATLVVPHAVASASRSKQAGRTQISIGYDTNLYEDPLARIAAPYLRLQYDRGWQQTFRSLPTSLELGVWTSVYPRHSQENKIFLHLSASAAREWNPRWSTRFTLLMRSKYFFFVPAGYREGRAQFSSFHRLPHRWLLENSVLLDLWRFEQNSRYNFNMTEYRAVLSKTVRKSRKVWVRFSVSRSQIPSFLWVEKGRIIVGQQNRTALAEAGLHLPFPWLVTFTVQFARNTSSIRALSFVQWSVQLTSVRKIHARWYVRSFFQYIAKRYSTPMNVMSQPFQPDPELGKGNRLTIDAVYLLSSSFSLVFRFRNLHLESVFRNRYYRKNLFEVLVEWQ